MIDGANGLRLEYKGRASEATAAKSECWSKCAP
jgi:hypothetical protein